MHGHRTTPWCGVLVAFLVCATTVAVAGPMQIVYEQHFTNGCAGWNLEAFTRSDQCCVVPLGTDGNPGLMGSAMTPSGGCGFRAASPSLEAMGIDPTAPYRVDFRYTVPSRSACWTYAMATRHVSLVLTECDPVRDQATLAFVDELAGTVQQAGRIRLSEWNDIEVRVFPRPSGGAAVGVAINGGATRTFNRANTLTHEGVVVMDLPYRIADETQIPMAGPSAFGSGAWDDIVVRQAGPGNTTPIKPDPHMDPNPLNPTSVLKFSLEREAHVQVELYDMSGRHVRSLFDGRLGTGPHAIPWDGRDDARKIVASGVYLVRTVINGEPTVSRATVVR